MKLMHGSLDKVCVFFRKIFVIYFWAGYLAVYTETYYISSGLPERGTKGPPAVVGSILSLSTLCQGGKT